VSEGPASRRGEDQGARIGLDPPFEVLRQGGGQRGSQGHAANGVALRWPEQDSTGELGHRLLDDQASAEQVDGAATEGDGLAVPEAESPEHADEQAEGLRHRRGDPLDLDGLEVGGLGRGPSPCLDRAPGLRALTRPANFEV